MRLRRRRLRGLTADLSCARWKSGIFAGVLKVWGASRALWAGRRERGSVTEQLGPRAPAAGAPLLGSSVEQSFAGQEIDPHSTPSAPKPFFLWSNGALATLGH